MAKHTRALPDPLDRRLAPRSQTDLRAAIELDGYTVPCAIRDRSRGGARIVLPKKQELPPTFRLVEVKSGRVHQAVLIWCDSGQAGVRLIGE